MALASVNVGSADARARRIAGILALLGGITALDAFFQPVGFLTWIVCAAMVYVAILLVMGGFREGTGPLGIVLALLAALDAWLPLHHLGYWGLIGGVALAGWTFLTARSRQDPVYRMLGMSTAEGR